MTTFSVKNTKVYSNLAFVESATYTIGNYALGVTCNVARNMASYISLGGSVISGCSFGGSISLARVSKYTNADVPAPTLTTYTSETFSSALVSETYTGSDITLSDNEYWSGL